MKFELTDDQKTQIAFEFGQRLNGIECKEYNCIDSAGNKVLICSARSRMGGNIGVSFRYECNEGCRECARNERKGILNARNDALAKLYESILFEIVFNNYNFRQLIIPSTHCNEHVDLFFYKEVPE